MMSKYQAALLTVLMLAPANMAEAGSESHPEAEVIRQGLILDLDADCGVKVLDGRVASWANQADWKVKAFAATRDADHEKGSGHPTLKERVAAIRGHSTVVFERHELINGNEDAFDHLITGSGYTWYAVMSVHPQVSGLKDVNSFFGNLKNSGNYEGFWAGLTDDNVLWMGSRNGITFGRWDQNNPQLLGPRLVENRYYIVAGRMGAGTGTVTIELFVNETRPVASKPFPVNSSANSSKMAIGQERDATNHPGHESFDGELARFLIWERPLSDGELDKTMSLLKETYGIRESDAESRQTYTYKQVGELKIKADVYRQDDRKIRPVIVWVHGGALIMGGREGVDGRVKKMFLDAGYAVVSIDYRLAPETKLPAIIEDIEDAFRWVREEGPELFGIGSSRIAVLGGSAGGYLTLATGYRVKPRPTVLVSFWGYGDLIGDWYSTPSPHARHQKSKMSEDDVRKQISGPPIANSADRNGDGGAFYQFCRQRGIWPSEVSGWDPHKEAKKFEPYMPLNSLTQEYPPTLLIHGTKDTDVPYEQSVMMAEQLKKHGIDHELITIEGAEHGLAGADPQRIAWAYERAFEFVHQRMTAGSPSQPAQ